MFSHLKISTKILILLTGFFVFLAICAVVAFLNLNKTLFFSQTISPSIEEIKKNSTLNSLAQYIRYYYEVLTQAARNYAFTGDQKWYTRYDEAAPLLDEKIKQAIVWGDEKDKASFQNIDAANLALVEMEEKSINLIDAGQKNEAIKILESEAYAKQKEIYKAGLEEYIKNKGKNYDDILTVSTTLLEESAKNTENKIIFLRWLAVLVFSSSWLFAFIFFLIVRVLLIKPINQIRNANREMAKGNLDQKIILQNHDEVGELAESFNSMVSKLKEARENLEDKIKKRTSDLEKTNKFMVGRELKMMELKKEIDSLKNKK